MKNLPVLRTLLAVFLPVWFLVLSARTAQADGLWQENGKVICDVAGNQYSAGNLVLPNGEVVVVWEGNNTTADPSDISIQKLSLTGDVLWQPQGEVVCNADAGQYSPQVCLSQPDGNILVVWKDRRNESNQDFCDIFIRKITPQGTSAPAWNSNGNVVCRNENDQSNPVLVSDLANGALVFWQDRRAISMDYDIFAQRLNADGIPAWAPMGVTVCSAKFSQFEPHAVAAGSLGGAVAVWTDERGFKQEDHHPNQMFDRVYAQRVGADGAVQWAANGVPLGNTYNAQLLPSLAAAGDQFVVAWLERCFDHTEKQQDKFVAQCLDRQGNKLWGESGLDLSPLSPPHENLIYINDPSNPHIQVISDGADGVVFTWSQKEKSGSDTCNYVYAQRILAADLAIGRFAWGAGVKVCPAQTAKNQNLPSAVIDQPGRTAMVVWEDWRQGNFCSLYAQRLDLSNGSLLWRSQGAAIAKGTDRHHFAPHLAADGKGGVAVDWRAGTAEVVTAGFDYNVRVQRINRAAPFVESIFPNRAKTGTQPITVQIRGFDFGDNLATVQTAWLESSGRANINAPVTWIDAKTLEARFELGSAAAGNWELFVADSLGQTSTSTGVLFSVFEYRTPPMTADARPNPWRPDSGSVTLFSFPEPSYAYQIHIFNLRGQKVRTLDSAFQWNGHNQQGENCESGVYAYQILLQGVKINGQVVLIR